MEFVKFIFSTPGHFIGFIVVLVLTFSFIDSVVGHITGK